MKDVIVTLEDYVLKEMGNMSASLLNWRSTIDLLIEKHGYYAELSVDGGHNDVQFKLSHTLRGDEVQELINKRSKRKETTKKLRKKAA